jgi:hypothetical protein
VTPFLPSSREQCQQSLQQFALKSGIPFVCAVCFYAVIIFLKQSLVYVVDVRLIYVDLQIAEIDGICSDRVEVKVGIEWLFERKKAHSRFASRSPDVC